MVQNKNNKPLVSMRLYFKIRNLQNLDLEGQKDVIKKYISQYCSFEKFGAVFVDFIIKDDIHNENVIPHVIGYYDVGPKADFEKIEAKINIYNLHEHFIILAINN